MNEKEFCNILQQNALQKTGHKESFGTNIAKIFVYGNKFAKYL